MTRQYDVVPPLTPSPAVAARGIWQKLVAFYGSADPRSLGLFRVALGALLFVDVALKLPEAEAHLSNAGWLPNHFALFKPMGPHVFSIYFAFGSPLEVKLMLTVHLLVCLLLVVGYRTKLMQILAVLLTTSLASRNLLIENGGTVVLNLLVVWSAFLPLGQRFSVDALRASLAHRRETSSAALNDRSDPPRAHRPVVSLAVTALLLQWATIYFFNALEKNGVTWRDGTAVHYLLQQDRLVTWFGARLRDVLPVSAIRGLTYSTLAIEWAVPVLLLSPLRPHLARLVALALAVILHVSIDSVLRLGSFSWAMLVAFIAFLPEGAWSRLGAYFRTRRHPSVLHYNPASGASLLLCRCVKRLDALGLVTFRPLDAESPKKTEKTLVVSAFGKRTEAGWDALVALADSLWFGSRPLRLLAPLFKMRVARRLAQLGAAPKDVDQLLGTQPLTAEADARAHEMSPARAVGARLLGTLREATVAGLLAVCASQVLVENPAVPALIRPQARPAWLVAIIEYPRLMQGWSMFAPDPPMSDGRLVVDGVTRDGRHLDPLTGQPPVFEVQPPGAPRTNLIGGYFHVRIADDRFRDCWNGVSEFLLRHHVLAGRPEDELSSFDAYYVSQQLPRPGEKKTPPERRKLFSSSTAPVGGAAPRARQKAKPADPPSPASKAPAPTK